jgi:hypothetical protein
VKRRRAKSIDGLRLMRATNLALLCLRKDGWTKRATMQYLKICGYAYTERLHGLVHALAWMRRNRVSEPA